MMKPLLYIDVDGVIVRFGTTDYDPTGEATITVAGRELRIPRNVSNRLGSLCGPLAPFEGRWATTWEEEAATALAPALGIGQDWAVVDLREDGTGSTSKLSYVLKDAGSRPFAWIDDELGPDIHYAADARADYGTPTLLIEPAPAIGLTDDHVNELWEFANSIGR